MKLQQTLTSMSVQFLAPTILVLGLTGCDGDDGSDGLNSLVKLTELSVGSYECPDGGQLIKSGLDSNSNNVLEDNEVSSETAICKGESGTVSANPVKVVSTSNHEIFVPNGYKELAAGAVPQGDYEGTLLFGGLAAASGVEEIAAFVVQRPTLGAGSNASLVLQSLRNTLSSMGIQLSNVATEKLSGATMRSNDRIRLSTSLTANALNNLIFEQLGGNIAGAQFTNLPADNPQAAQVQEFRCLLTVQYFSEQDIVVTSAVIRESELANYEALVEGLGDGSNVGNRGSQRRAGADQFEVQGSSNKADFLWVVDNSISMADKQQAVANAGTEFSNRVKNANLDFQVGVITTDSAQLRGTGFTLDITQFQVDVVAGISGSTTETGIWFAEQSLQSATLGDSSNGSVTSLGVPRTGASLSVIILSDEESQYTSRSSVAFDETNNLFIDRGYMVYAIVDPAYAQSSQYDNLALNTGGTIGDITDLSGIPAIIQQIVDRAGGMTPFILAHQPISSTLVVGINGKEVSHASVDGWQYFPNSNTIAFFGNAMPQTGDTVQVTYEYIET
ncbi:MAG: hypothetical protein DRR16_18180 [Candidatus Parabeggiatoa sp. nov. 3]|nr:MAG: hypothetical protein DRR00_07955 [Gammaproteobacteria bacterium]RKZ66098.1 MAG: hypothetical protein DRQ99_10710 [Gammaproteobacteria bacterium]RKZ83092.1 MAG: hypothetical protein DRR16_18180 [Gammaproteobacteria bacterium]